MRPTKAGGDLPPAFALPEAGEFPDWADLLVDSYGTDHDIYRLGDGLVARLPPNGWAITQAAKEAEWLRGLRPICRWV